MVDSEGEWRVMRGEEGGEGRELWWIARILLKVWRTFEKGVSVGRERDQSVTVMTGKEGLRRK